MPYSFYVKHREYETCLRRIFVLLPVFVILTVTSDIQKAQLQPQSTVYGEEPDRPQDLSHINLHEGAIPIKNSIGMRLVLIPAGQFMMGNHRSLQEEKPFLRQYNLSITKGAFKTEQPLHLVKIRKPFYMGIYPVTRGQFRQFAKETKYITDAERGHNPGAMEVNIRTGDFFQFQPNHSWRNVVFHQTDNHPVVDVSWNDANAFCEWLSRKEGKKYRLPCEGEWEYACRAGTTTRYWFGDDPEKLAINDNTADAEFKAKFPRMRPEGDAIHGDDGYVFTSPVGSFKANTFGLFDMQGNVHEWCWDLFRWYRQSALEAPQYQKSSSNNAPGANLRVVRGGSWLNGPFDCRCASRDGLSPCYAGDNVGFRVVREVTDKELGK